MVAADLPARKAKVWRTEDFFGERSPHMDRRDRRSVRFFVAAAAAAWIVGGTVRSEDRPPAVDPGAKPRLQQLVPADGPLGPCGGEPCDAVARGFLHFFDRSPDGMAGNGRSCGDCHMVTDHFQLSPADAERQFQFLQWLKQFNPNADDPLFRPIDADDFRTNGEDASDFSNLRENGLVRITFELPPNMKLIDPLTNLPSAETFADVWRAVPTVNDVKITGP